MQIGITNEQASNIVLWQGLTQEGLNVLEELRQAKKIHQLPAHLLSYLHDGKMLRLPLAKRPPMSHPRQAYPRGMNP